MNMEILRFDGTVEHNPAIDAWMERHPSELGAVAAACFAAMRRRGMSGVENNNVDSEKILRVWWTGVKYAVDPKTDVTFPWYEQLRNNFRVPQICSATAGFRASCAGSQRGFALCRSPLHEAFRRPHQLLIRTPGGLPRLTAGDVLHFCLTASG